MLTLAVDTSTYLGAVAVARGPALLAEQAVSVRAAHGETLLPHVRACLEAARVRLAQLELLAVGLGPGSFTGVRIGVATLKGLALAERKPLVGVCSLRAIARGIDGGDGVRLSVVDAHKGEVYCGAFQLMGQRLEPVVPPFHLPPEQAIERVLGVTGDAPLWAAGDAFERYGDVLRRGLGTRLRRAPAFCDGPRGASLAYEAQLAFEERGADDLAALEPTYLRPSDAKRPGAPPQTPSS